MVECTCRQKNEVGKKIMRSKQLESKTLKGM
jgi:hypothetical protein